MCKHETRVSLISFSSISISSLQIGKVGEATKTFGILDSFLTERVSNKVGHEVQTLKFSPELYQLTGVLVFFGIKAFFFLLKWLVILNVINHMIGGKVSALHIMDVSIFG